MTTTLQSWERWFLFALLLFSIALRVVFLLQVIDNPFFHNPTSDAYYYDAQAQSIAAGDVVGRDVFFRAPGYPYWLALIYILFGRDYLAVRIIQHLLGVGVILLLYLLARRLFRPAVAVVASLTAALYAVFIYFEGQLLFDGFLTFLCTAWLLLFYSTREKISVWHSLLVGFFFGVICVVRPTFLPLALALFGLESWRWYHSGAKRQALHIGMALFSGASLAILPVTVRNYVVGNDLVLIASQGGINFFIGNNPSANGFSATMPGDIGASWEISEMTFYVEKQIGHRPIPSEESSFWYRQGFEFIVHYPFDSMKLLLKKVYLFWNAIEIPNNLSFYTFSQYSPLLRVLPVGFWFVGPLGLYGLILAVKRRRAGFLAAFVAMYCAIVVAFFVCDRYRLPVVPMLCVFSGYALVELTAFIRRKEFRTVLISFTVLILLATFVNSNVYNLEKEEPVHQFYMLGLIAQANGHHAEAVEHFKSATGYNKPIRNLYLHLGTGEWMLGQDSSATESFRRELMYHPDSYGALASLSAIFLTERSLDSAIEYGNRAVRVRPYMSAAYVSLGQTFLLLGEAAAAESVLALGAARCGPAFTYGNVILAGVLLQRGRIASAESLYRSILVPNHADRDHGYEAEFLFTEEKRTGVDMHMLRAKSLYGLGHVFARRRQLDSATAYFQWATTLSPSFADAWADLGVALLQLRSFADADSAMTQALRLMPDNFMYWYNYGSLLGTTGKFKKAKEALERSLSLRPGFELARRDLAFVENALRKR